MSLNYRRNIFTLGDFHVIAKQKLKRHQPADLFEKDPFKINSYNFRYAERPFHPTPNLQQRISSGKNLKNCQTYFHNYDFSNTNNSRTHALHTDGRSLNITKFQEYRRRKFLQESGFYRNNYLGGIRIDSNESDILNSYYDNKNVDQSQESLKRSANSLLLKKMGKQSCPLPQPLSNERDPLPSTSSGIKASRKCSLSSGCEININIKTLDDNRLQDKVEVKIETDSFYRNLNTIYSKTLNFERTKGGMERLNSHDALIADKKRSNFSSNQEKNSDKRKQELCSIYSSEIVRKSPKARYIKSAERLPSLIPFKGSIARINNSSLSKENCKRNNLSVYDNKASTKNCSHNSLYRNSNLSVNGKSKVLNSPYIKEKTSLSKILNKTQPKTSSLSSTYTPSLSSNIKDFKSSASLRSRSNAKLPVKVNINVFGDKLKLLKV